MYNLQRKNMKKILLLTLIMLVNINLAMAQQNTASIKFEKTLHNFGEFSENEPIQTCAFKFTNVGTAPLIKIGRASCRERV